MWENICKAVGTLVVLAGATLLLIIILAPKNVDYYYASRGDHDSNPGICVYAHWTWHSDEVVYCSDDKDKVLDFIVKANAALPPPKK